jgi:UPF0755 protein
VLRRLIPVALVLGLIVGGAVGWRWWGPGPLGKAATVTIEQGATLADVASLLARQGAIPDRTSFYYLGRLLGGGDPIQAGEFEIPARSSAAGILDLLQHGQPVQRLITVPEGMPSILVQERLAALPYAAGPAPLPPEGAVLPDSYTYERGESRAAILARMTTAMDRTFEKLWAGRKGDCPVGNRTEVITLASIVEKETGKPSERRMVAGVYCNRLKIGMKLDADPTVIYPVTKGKPLGRRILRSELNAQNGYNTYRMAGLPIGPIANPGKESIAAVLDPAPTRALYFVADGTGGHVFANTLAEHNANVAKWYKLRRERGQM